MIKVMIFIQLIAVSLLIYVNGYKNYSLEKENLFLKTQNTELIKNQSSDVKEETPDVKDLIQVIKKITNNDTDLDIKIESIKLKIEEVLSQKQEESKSGVIDGEPLTLKECKIQNYKLKMQAK